ncbi:MAG: FadR family transcriptional regulator [Deltaproteobacteria bacterium]|nr:FadR family transcriptional regulator [Deltaproteobacteria bacterium]
MNLANFLFCEALQTLTQLRVIEQRPKHGTVILTKTPFLYSKHLLPPLTADNEVPVELIQARRFIVAGAADLAAKNATKAQIKELGALVQDMVKVWEAGNDSAYRDYTEKNITFHFLIAKASHNRFMVHFMATIRGLNE